jgi:hypothetical protein
MRMREFFGQLLNVCLSGLQAPLSRLTQLKHERLKTFSAQQYC